MEEGAIHIQPYQEKKSRWWIWLITLLIIFMIAAIVLVLVFSMKDKNDDSSKEKETTANNISQELESLQERCINSCEGFCVNIGESYNGQSQVSSSKDDVCECNCGGEWTEFNSNTGEKIEVESQKESSGEEDINSITLDFFQCIIDSPVVSCPSGNDKGYTGDCVKITNCETAWINKKKELWGSDWYSYTPDGEVKDIWNECYVNTGDNPTFTWENEASQTYIKAEKRTCLAERIS